MFSMEICVVLWPISQSPERKWRIKHTGAGTWEECVHPLAFRMEPCLLGCAVHDHHPIIWTDAQLRRDLFCFVFIFASPLMTAEGITKLTPYACEIPFDSFYCNGRWQRLSEQKKQAWEKVNIEHLLGNKAPLVTFAAASLWRPESDGDSLTGISSCLRKCACSLSLGFAEF